MKPMPASAMEVSTCSGDRSKPTPSADKTSLAPDFEDAARLPCLATGTPQAAVINAASVEILNVPCPSPPVPTMSIAPAGAATRSIFRRSAATAPVSSATLSPRTRSAIRNPPSWAGVTLPAKISSKADFASSSVRLAPDETLAMSGLNASMCGLHFQSAVCGGRLDHAAAPFIVVPLGRKSEEILKNTQPMFGRDAFGVELHAMRGKLFVRKPHDETIGLRRHRQDIRHGLAADDERMVARCEKRPVDAVKNRFALMIDRGELAMHGLRGPDDLAAIGLAKRLMAEADPKNWNGGSGQSR